MLKKSIGHFDPKIKTPLHRDSSHDVFASLSIIRERNEQLVKELDEYRKRFQAALDEFSADAYAD